MPTEATVRADNGAPRVVTGVTVVAVVVAHDGAGGLPGLRAAVEAQTAPLTVVAADTGSCDGSVGLLQDWLGPQRLVVLDEATGYGEAVRAALAVAPEHSTSGASWVWLLHDDCEPAPDALEHLLAEVARDPAVAVAGPKVCSLTDRRLLLEVGVTISRSGRRETSLERGEHDQGQHDGTREVLSVGTAGMLVRSDVWAELGGLEPRLPFLRDDVDLGWRAHLAGHRVVCVTDAVIYHAEAGSHRRRAVTAGGHRHARLGRLDRRHALFVLLANLPLLLLPVSAVSLTVGSVLRALGLLAGKRPVHAADEVLALLAVLGRPDRLVRARHDRRRTRAVPARTALPLLAQRGSGARHALERAGRVGTDRDDRDDRDDQALSATGPTAEEDEALPLRGTGLVRGLLLRPSVGLVLGLVALTPAAGRRLFGDGRLQGGALLPAPDRAQDWWAAYLSTWHPVGIGSDTPAPAYVGVLGALSTVLGGTERAVTFLLLAAVPLSALTAYLALRPVLSTWPLRVWAAAGYALLPAVLGAVAGGRLGTAVVAVLLPLAALAVGRALGLGGGDARAGSTRSAWAGVLVLSVMAAFVPLVAGLAAALGLLAVVVLRGRNLVRVAVLVLVPPLLLLPSLPALAQDPSLLLLESGLAGPGLAAADLAPVEVLLLAPGGPGTPPALLTAALVLAALAALLRRDKRRPVVVGWVLALVGLGAAAVLSGVRVTAPTLETPVPVWPGPAMVLAGAGLLLAAAAGAEGAGERVRRSSFGWRQPGAALVTGLALAAPFGLAGWWAVTGADGPLSRRDPVLLPAFVAAEGDQPDRPRTLVLRAGEPGSLSYALLRSAGPRTGDAEVITPSVAGRRLDGVVAELASGRGGDAAARLVPYGVRFILLSRPVDEAVARAVDSVPGVVRVSSPAGGVLWRLDYPTGRLRVLAAGAPVVEDDGSPPAARVLPAGDVTARAVVPAGAGRRLLVLADPRDGGWRARVDGQALSPRTYDGWAQAFVLPRGGGSLVLEHSAGIRPVLLWLQLGLVLLVVVLALPQARTGDDEPLDAAAPPGVQP